MAANSNYYAAIADDDSDQENQVEQVVDVAPIARTLKALLPVPAVPLVPGLTTRPKLVSLLKCDPSGQMYKNQSIKYHVGQTAHDLVITLARMITDYVVYHGWDKTHMNVHFGPVDVERASGSIFLATIAMQEGLVSIKLIDKVLSQKSSTRIKVVGVLMWETVDWKTVDGMSVACKLMNEVLSYQMRQSATLAGVSRSD